MRNAIRKLGFLGMIGAMLIGASQLSACALVAAGAAGAVIGHEVAEEEHDDD